MVWLTETRLYISIPSGLLRDHGLTAMLLQGGMDRELTSRIVKRAQWLTEQYVCSFPANIPTLGVALLDEGGLRASLGRRCEVRERVSVKGSFS